MHGNNPVSGSYETCYDGTLRAADLWNRGRPVMEMGNVRWTPLVMLQDSIPPKRALLVYNTMLGRRRRRPKERNREQWIEWRQEMKKIKK